MSILAKSVLLIAVSLVSISLVAEAASDQNVPVESSGPDVNKSGAKVTNVCAVSYSKGGIDEVVGTNRSLTTCKSILKSIQYNLETSKWSCRNVQTAVVTTGREVIAQ